MACAVSGKSLRPARIGRSRLPGVDAMKLIHAYFLFFGLIVADIPGIPARHWFERAIDAMQLYFNV